jgi:aryl-alcohol dehydrogenase-like predicted oxidoreductase
MLNRSGSQGKIMDTIEIGDSGITASRVALNTRAMGGWTWGGDTADLKHSIGTIRAAIERGITLIDTAPVYGFGLAERIVGTVLAGGLRDRAIIATQGGLQWQNGKMRRDSSPAHIRKEVEESLRRLRTDHIDLYQMQSPDPLVPIRETAQTLVRLMEEGKIRAIGVSNYLPAQMDEFRQAAPIHAVRTRYNLFERGIQNGVLRYARQHGTVILCHGVLCRGLLTGMITPATQFNRDDLRRSDPRFQEPRFSEYLAAVASLNRYARACYGLRVSDLAVRWVLDQANTIALWDASQPEQLDSVGGAMGWKLDEMAKRHIENIIRHTVRHPIDPELIAPPSRSEPALAA